LVLCVVLASAARTEAGPVLIDQQLPGHSVIYYADTDYTYTAAAQFIDPGLFVNTA
jgi:hypothetical protein